MKTGTRGVRAARTVEQPRCVIIATRMRVSLARLIFHFLHHSQWLRHLATVVVDMGGSSGFLMRVVDDSMTSSPAWNRNHAILPFRPSNYAIRSVAVNVHLAERDPGSPLPRSQASNNRCLSWTETRVSNIFTMQREEILFLNGWHLTACI